MACSPDLRARRRAILGLPAYLPGYPKEISGQTKANQSLLSARMVDQGFTGVSICNIPFGKLAHCASAVDILSCATPERYHLVHCTDAVSNRALRILEFTSFPNVQYAALSYVWRGNRPANDSRLGMDEFSVSDAEDADPIGLGILSDLDRLCIMQANKRDRQWQIREMYRMYTFSSVCIVSPGGLRFLVPFGEETEWIHRGWTLKELGHHSRIEVVNPGTSAMMGLEPFLGVCSCGHFEFTPDGSDETVSPLLIEAALLGKPQTRVKSVSTVAHDSSIRLLDVAALAFATASYMHTDEMRDFCIWQRALVRKSSRPVDMVFSITGILGLGLSVNLPPSPHVSTFPEFSQTSVAGRTMYSLANSSSEIVTLTDAIYPNDDGLSPPLKGSMDATGCHSFDALAIMVVPTTTTIDLPPSALYGDVAPIGSIPHYPNDTGSKSLGKPRSFAVMLGFYNGIPAVVTSDTVRALLVTEYAPDKFHARSYFLLSEKALRWASTLTMHHFCVGGPET
ncbi:hypothetical protein F4804DRAFT_349048 [Jackrogersella minutella]|nr:hypothetical protein F4804DRAFT_349048 [Jackrogersella minutella]